MYIYIYIYVCMFVCLIMLHQTGIFQHIALSSSVNVIHWCYIARDVCDILRGSFRNDATSLHIIYSNPYPYHMYKQYRYTGYTSQVMQAFFHQPYHTDSLNPNNCGLQDDVPFQVLFCSGSISLHFRWKITEPATVGLLHCRGCENSLNCERWEWEPCCRGLGLPVGCLLKAVSK